MSQFDFIEQSSLGSGFVYKNESVAYVYGVVNFVATTGTGTTVLNIESVTDGIIQPGLTLTGLSVPVTITSFGTFDGVSGTVNISETATWTNPTNVSGIGFIKVTDADYPEETVRGIVYLDGAYYVMTPDGTIYGSELKDPYTWTALNAIQTLAEPDGGVALFRQLNLIVAFSDYSTEFFYNAANPPPGSPLSPYTSAALQLGCAHSGSIATAENTIFFMGKAKQKGRSIYKLEGTKPEVVSNPFIDKLLDFDDLDDVLSYCIKLKGHLLYFITLKSSNLTLVLDNTTGMWNLWTQLITGVSIDLSSDLITSSWADGLATLTINNHSLEDGSFTRITNAGNFTGEYVINTPDSNTVTFPLDSDPGELTTGTLQNYIETSFNMANYNKAGNTDIVQDSTTGFVYALDSDTYLDGDLPIKYRIRTSKFDADNNKNKFFKQIEIIGDKVDATAYLRYTNDDYVSYSQFRPINLSLDRSKLERTGKARRRAYEIINYDNEPLRLESLELIAKEGIQ